MATDSCNPPTSAGVPTVWDSPGPTWKPKQMVGMTLKTEAQENALWRGGTGPQ